jgi:hypothetical protein
VVVERFGAETCRFLSPVSMSSISRLLTPWALSARLLLGVWIAGGGVKIEGPATGGIVAALLKGLVAITVD